MLIRPNSTDWGPRITYTLYYYMTHGLIYVVYNVLYIFIHFLPIPANWLTDTDFVVGVLLILLYNRHWRNWLLLLYSLYCISRSRDFMCPILHYVILLLFPEWMENGNTEVLKFLNRDIIYNVYIISIVIVRFLKYVYLIYLLM